MKTGVLSVVMPIYNEPRMGAHISRVTTVLKQANIPYELILVDDGSIPSVWAEVAQIATQNEGVVAISLSRNFGKENALCAGLDAATGDCAVCVDSDMQFPPEVIPHLYQLWQQGFDVIEGVKKKRQREGLWYKLFAGTFYALLHKTADIDLKNGSDFRLLDRCAIDAWRAMPEKQTFFRGMSSWVGFRRTQYEFDVADRAAGSSKWTTGKLIGFAMDAVTSYTAAPLYAAAFLGVLFFLFAIIMGIDTLYMFLSGKAQSGFTTVILLLLFIGAVILLALGVIGIYIKKIYEEVKGRPRYIIRQRIDKK